MPFKKDRLSQILIVDDGKDFREAFKEFLAHFGYQIQEAPDGRKALDLLRKSRDIDLVLMDVHMPEIDGLQATRAIREHERQTNAHVPIIAMTACAMKGDEERIRAGGCAAYIAKPISVVHFLDTIKKFLEPSPEAETAV